MQQHLNAPLPVKLSAMPGADDQERARYAVEAIRLRVAAQLVGGLLLVELRLQITYGQPIADFTPTAEVPQASVLDQWRAAGLIVREYRPQVSRWRRLLPGTDYRRGIR
jgi:hypothetical protein